MADKFAKSASNSRTQKAGLSLLLTDRRFQVVDLACKRVILKALVADGRYGPRSFDCVMTPQPVEELTVESIGPHLGSLRLVEMKTTRKSIGDVALNRFFFGATAREFELAETIGSRFLFAFVVLSDNNAYGHPFAVLLTHAQVVERTRTKRVQYQVNFRSDMGTAAARHELLLLDSATLVPGAGKPDRSEQ